MSRSSSSSPSGARAHGFASRGLPALREVVDQLRGPGERRDDGHARSSEVRDAVLGVLAEQPASGYRVVQVLEERSGGERTPGAGAVYPALQLMADEGLVTSAETDGRKIWTLTAAGQAAADAVSDRGEAWSSARTAGPVRRGAIVRSSAQLVQTAALAAQTASSEQVGDIVAVLDEARRRILSILVRS